MTINRRALIGAGLTAGALGSVVGLPHLARAQSPSIDEVLNDPVAPEQGNPEGDVTIVEYFDYQCPYCKAMHPLLRDVVEADGNVRLVMKDWPIFGPPSTYATRLALGAVGLDRYAAVNAALMDTEARLTQEQVEEVVGAVVTLEEAQASYRENADKWNVLLQRNDRQAVALGFRGTPAFAIGTTLYGGVLDRETLPGAIAKARSA